MVTLTPSSRQDLSKNLTTLFPKACADAGVCDAANLVTSCRHTRPPFMIRPQTRPPTPPGPSQAWW